MVARTIGGTYGPQLFNFICGLFGFRFQFKPMPELYVRMRPDRTAHVYLANELPEPVEPVERTTPPAAAQTDDTKSTPPAPPPAAGAPPRAVKPVESGAAAVASATGSADPSSSGSGSDSGGSGGSGRAAAAGKAFSSLMRFTILSGASATTTLSNSALSGAAHAAPVSSVGASIWSHAIALRHSVLPSAMQMHSLYALPFEPNL